MLRRSSLVRFVVTLFISVPLPCLAQSQRSVVQDIISQVNSDSAVLFAKELSGAVPTNIGGLSYTIVSRHKNQPGNDKAAQYIKQKLESYGLQTSLQSFSTTGKNVIGTKTGTAFPRNKYIICAHFDDVPSGTTAPGADDNASGTAAVIEAARILKNYSFPYTIIFALWDEEEQGSLGSFSYADQASEAGDSVMGVVNLDMIAWDSDSDNRVYIHTKPIANSMGLSATMVEINSAYGIGLAPLIENPGITNSDHASFWNVDYSAIALSEDHHDDFNQYYHTANDKVQYFNVPFYRKNIQLALGTLVTLARNMNILITHTPVASTSSTTPISVIANIQSGSTLGTGPAAPRLYYRTKGTGNYSSFAAVTGSGAAGGNYSFTIPAQPLGTVVQYYIAAQDSEGSSVVSSPLGASGFTPPGTTPPTTLYTFYVANIAVVFADSAMNASAWTATGTWGLTSAKFVSPPRSFASSPGGLYKNNETSTFAVNNPLNLGSVLGASLEFSMQFQLEPGFDYVQFQVSTDNGATWTPMAGQYTKLGSGSFQPNGKPLYDGIQNEWVRERIDMSAFSGRTIRTRFFFTSDQETVDAGVCIDDIVLYTYSATPLSVESLGRPSSFSLMQNYPNPFNPTTVISGQLPVAGWVTLSVYDLLGREVAMLLNGHKEAGSFQATFDGTGLASGVYVYRMSVFPEARRDLLPASWGPKGQAGGSAGGRDRQAGDFVETKRMLLIR